MAIVVAVVSLVPCAATGQVGTETWTPSRTPDGQPDLQGFWNNEGTPFFIGFDLEKGIPAEELELHGLDPMDYKSPIVDPAAGKIPYQPWAARRKTEISLGEPGALEFIDPVTRCLPAGVPRINYVTPYNGYQFLQIPGYVVMFAEWNHTSRIIPLDGRPHIGQDIGLWMGDSRGHWEGNTLVVDVTNFNGQTWFDLAGSTHSDALHVVERFTIVDAETIHYEATIEDWSVFTRPWKLAASFRRVAKDYTLFEYACHEGNHAVENILSR